MSGPKPLVAPALPEPTAEEPVPDYSQFSVESATISEPQKVPGQLMSFLQVTLTPKSMHGTRAKVPCEPQPVTRNATDFAWLRNQLVFEVPGAIVPPVPQVAWSTHLVKDEDESPETCEALEMFLAKVLAHPELSSVHSIKVFCLSPTEVLDAAKAASSSSALSSASLGGHWERMKEALGVPTEGKHVVESDYDEDVAIQQQWVAELQQSLSSCQKYATSLFGKADDVESDVTVLAEAVHEAAAPLGVEADAVASAVGAPRGAGPARKSIEANLADFVGYADAAAEAIGQRERLRLQLQAARLNHQKHIESNAALDESLKAREEGQQQLEALSSSDPSARGVASLTAEQKIRLRQVFSQFDQDRSGVIDVSELKLTFHVLGKPLTRAQLDAMQAQLSKEGLSNISFDKFMELAAPRLLDQGAEGGGGALDSTIEQIKHQCHVIFLYVKTAYVGCVAGTQSSVDDVSSADEMRQSHEDDFNTTDLRLKREMEWFQGHAADRIRAISSAFVAIEHEHAAARKNMLKALVRGLGADVVDPAELRTRAEQNPTLKKLNASAEAAAADAAAAASAAAASAASAASGMLAGAAEGFHDDGETEEA